MDAEKFSCITEDIIAIKPLFYKAFGKPAPVSVSIAPGAYYAMLQLDKDGVLTMSDLGKKLYISRPNVTVLIDKLISYGFAERLTDKEDRRFVRIRLTSKGTRFIKKNIKLFKEQIRSRLTSLSEEELNIFSTSLQQVKAILSKIPVNQAVG
jgi:DNA-binding MarR family transcriptional regulator